MVPRTWKLVRMGEKSKVAVPQEMEGKIAELGLPQRTALRQEPVELPEGRE